MVFFLFFQLKITSREPEIRGGTFYHLTQSKAGVYELFL